MSAPDPRGGDRVVAVVVTHRRPELLRASLAAVAGHVVALARAEDLPGHGDAVLARVGEVAT